MVTCLRCESSAHQTREQQLTESSGTQRQQLKACEERTKGRVVILDEDV
jgi:hypothetical protein